MLENFSLVLGQFFRRHHLSLSSHECIHHLLLVCFLHEFCNDHSLMNHLTYLFVSTVACALCLLPPETFAQIRQDNFNDGDDVGWERYSMLDVVGASSVFTLPETIKGDYAYRMLSPAPPVEDAGPARSYSLLPDIYTDFYAAVDVLDWNNEVGQAFGFVFRAENIGLGQTTGYVMNYNPQNNSGARGQIEFSMVSAESNAGAVGSARLSLEPGHNYRFVAAVAGSTFRGWVYDHLDLTLPLVAYSGESETYKKGQIGLFNFYAGSSPTDAEIGIADTTFDNYYTSPDAPESLGTHGWYGFVERPRVVFLEPGSRAAYQAAKNGLQCSIALAEDQVSIPAFKLYLNGKDVSSEVSMAKDGSMLHLDFQALESNRVYDAVIEFPEYSVLARTEWTFDTFEQAFLSSDNVVQIEAEDYNFDGGKYLENPAPSGFSDSGQGVNASTGYLDREGLPEIDFFDYNDAPGTEEEAAFRVYDPVATQAGSSESDASPAVVNDVLRKANSDLKIPEYQVTGTRGGEWMNYTRDFPEGDYNVYLRAAGRAMQAIHLDEVTSGSKVFDQTVTRLGTFMLPNMGMKYNYRFIPLKDVDGNPVKLTLGGVTTLRIAIGDTDEDRVNNTTALNYLLFTPALEVASGPIISILGATALNGPYTAVADAVIDAGHITVPANEEMQFFKILDSSGSSGSLVIQGVSIANGHLLVNFSN